ncbi:MAG: GAF domain-containing protein [Rhodospirillales bacterium]|nr:MAG: GAF domain-containing protein [Rhodospirillales bacterium]
MTALRDREGIRSFVLVPLRREGAFLGYISANWAEPRSNVASEVALLESFADQAVIAIENARLLREQREALERQTAMAEVLAVINASPGDLTHVFSMILDKALSLSRSSLGSLIRFDGEKFWQVAWRNIPQPVLDIGRGGHVPEAGTLLHRLILGDDVAHLADITDDEVYRAGARSRVIMADEAGARTLLTVALRKDGRLLGGVQIYRTEVRAFSEAEVTLVRSFADQAVIAMENARLITETREALEQQTATADILRIISQSPTDVQPVLDAVVAAAARLCEADGVAIALRDGDSWVDAAHIGPIQTVTGERISLSRESIVGRAIIDARTMHVPDVEKLDPVEFAVGRALSAQNGTRAVLVAPMLREGVAIGAIGLRRREPGPFTPRQIALLESFAAQAVIAIENVRLFTELDARNTELREALEQQTATAEILRVISQSPTDVQPVLDAVVKAAVRFCGATDTMIILRDGDNLVAAAHEGPLSFSGVGDRRPLDRSSSSGRATIDGKTVHIPDVSILDPEEYGQTIALARSHGFRAAIAAPMLRDGTAIGSVLLRKVDAGPFTPQQIALLETFAAQAVIAIENVRLFTGLREALEQQTATAEILRVISQSPTDIGPVLTALVTAARRFCGATDAMIALRDGDESVTAAHDGPLGAVIGARAWLDPRGRGTVRAIVERRTIHVPDVMAPDQHEFAISRALGSEQNFRAFITTPMMREGVAIGSIGLRRSNPGPFTPRQIAARDLRRPGGDRHRERPAVHRAGRAQRGTARVFGAADRHGRGARRHQRQSWRAWPGVRCDAEQGDAALRRDGR